MFIVRPCATLELSSLPGIPVGNPFPSELFSSAPDSVSLVVSNDSGSCVGGLFLIPLKRIADTVLSYKVAWIHVSPEYRGQEVECLLLREAARAAGSRGAKSVQLAVKPRTEAALGICGNIPVVPGVSVVVSLQHDGI